MEIKSRRLVVILLLIFPLLLLVSCQKEEEDDRFNIVVFSALPDSVVDDMETFAEKELAEDVKVTLYPPAVERLMIEVIERSGDVIITDRAILPSVHDTDGLHNLEEFRVEKNTVKMNAYELAMLKREGLEVGEEEIYPNALKVLNTSLFLDEKVYDLDLVDLTMIIPRYTEYEKAAFTIVEQLAQKK